MERSHLITLLIAGVAGSAAGVVASTSFATRPQAAAPEAAANPDGEGRLARLERENDELRRAVAELRDAQSLLASHVDRTPAQGAVAAAAPAPAPEAAPASTPEAGAPALTLDAALALLTDPEASYADRTAMWEKVNKAGLLDQVVEAIEGRVERAPNDPGLRVELGNAYLQEVFAASELGKGRWAMKADAAFDAALELDPNHWEARFTKAVALSNWPAFLGKQSAAIAEFETLIQQQNSGPKQPHHWQTYLYLGNMYQASGSNAKALEAWQQGSALFPENSALAQQIANAKRL